MYITLFDMSYLLNVAFVINKEFEFEPFTFSKLSSRTCTTRFDLFSHERDNFIPLYGFSKGTLSIHNI